LGKGTVGIYKYKDTHRFVVHGSTATPIDDNDVIVTSANP